jgi:hypothetical protein
MQLPALPCWNNSSPGWLVVPTDPSHYANYYLEWRARTKYDRMKPRTSTYADEDEWQWNGCRISRGAVYSRQPLCRQLPAAAEPVGQPALAQVPTAGVDMNYGPCVSGTRAWCSIRKALRCRYDPTRKS